jgi:hypothetical protein
LYKTIYYFNYNSSITTRDSVASQPSNRTITTTSQDSILASNDNSTESEEINSRNNLTVLSATDEYSPPWERLRFNDTLHVRQTFSLQITSIF